MTDIHPTAEELYKASTDAYRLNDFLDRCNRTGVFSLIGFDLDYLGDQFERAAKEALELDHSDVT